MSEPVSKRDRNERRTQQERTEASRQKLIAAGRKLVAREGWESLTISAVSAEAGVYSYAVQYHFGGKAGLIAVLVDEMLKAVFEGLQRNLADLSGDEDPLHAMLQALHASSDPELDQLFFDTLVYASRDEELRKLLVAQYERHATFVLSALNRWDVDPGQARLLAYLSLAVADGLAIQRLLDPEGLHRQLQDSFEGLLKLKLGA